MSATSSNPAPVAPPKSLAARRLHVLVADDRALVRRRLRQLLEGERRIALEGGAVDLESTTSAVAERRPDVLVLDLCAADGPLSELLGELRTRAPRTHTVIVSADDAPGVAQRALAAGASAFVLRESAEEDLPKAILAASRGEEYLSAPLARRLAALRQARTAGRLTVRESEILRLIALGHTNVEIARQLGVSSRTVETHRANIHGKLNLRTRAELVRYALGCGLLEP